MRQKLTGADVEAKFGEWGRRTRARLPGGSTRTPGAAGRKIAALGLGLALLGVGAAQYFDSASFQTQRAEIGQRIADLEAPAPVAAQAPVTTAEELRTLVATATRAADTVAAGQEESVNLSYQAAHESAPGNGAPGEVTMALVQHRRTLAAQWAPTSLVVDEELAYRFDTATSFEPEQIDPRWPWYVRHDGTGDVSPPAASTWATESVTPAQIIESGDGTGDASATGQGVTVSWTCRAATSNELLAWASADWDPDTGTFDNLRVVTMAGSQRAGSQVDPNDDGPLPNVAPATSEEVP